MAFKFSLLSLERTKNCEEVNQMVKRKSNGRKKGKLQKSLESCKGKKGKSWNKCLKSKGIKRRKR